MYEGYLIAGTEDNVLIFSHNGTDWVEHQTLKAQDTSDVKFFGQQIAVSAADGKMVAQAG